MLFVAYPKSRFESNTLAVESFNDGMVSALQRTILELRQYNRANDHKFRSLPNQKLWISDIGGRRGGRLLYFKKADTLIIWGIGKDHKIEEEADRYFTNILKEDEILDGKVIDVTAKFLSSEEKKVLAEKSKVFAGNLSDQFLQDVLLLNDYQISEVRKSNALSLWELNSIDEMTRFKLTQFLKLPQNTLLAAKDEQHLLGFIRGSNEKLMIHLDNYQEEIIADTENKTCLIRGETGSGKTTILIYKAIYHAEANPDQTCILFTFNIALANMIKESVEELMGEQISNLKIYGIYEWLVEAAELYLGEQTIIEKSSEHNIYSIFSGFCSLERCKILLTKRNKSAQNLTKKRLIFFIKKEIEEIILEYGLKTETEYLCHKRKGTDRILGKRQRQLVWSIYQDFLKYLHENNLTTYKRIMVEMLEVCKRDDFAFKHDAIFADEIQDLSPVAIKTIKALLKTESSLVVLAGDYKQSIYRKSFSWREVSMPFYGQNVIILRKNYRNSVQILAEANRLISHFNFPWKEPLSSGREGADVQYLYYEGKEKIQKLVGLINFIHFDQDIAYSDIAIFSPAKKVEKLTDQLISQGVPAIYLKNSDGFYQRDCVKISTLHSAKGLEFRVVILINIESDLFNLLTDNNKVKTELAIKLLYVGITRAYDCLFFLVQKGVVTHDKLDTFLNQPKLNSQ